MATSIYDKTYDELKAKVKHLHGYKQYAPALNMLNREGIGDIILDGNTFWFEYPKYVTATDREIKLLIKYLTNQGYKCLYREER